ncbi:hypothetical protein [Streptomyces sp. NPDC002403]
MITDRDLTATGLQHSEVGVRPDAGHVVTVTGRPLAVTWTATSASTSASVTTFPAL